MNVFLNNIIEDKIKEIQKCKKITSLSNLRAMVDSFSFTRRNFKASLHPQSNIAIIAEVKKASPSKGILCKEFDPVRIASLYEQADANAISVLTESTYFKGDLLYIESIREKVNVPLLRKDFIIDEYQLYETVIAAADAVLLISSLLEKNELKRFIAILRSYKVDALVEIHNELDLYKALDSGADIIGINNRNLETFDVDLNVTRRIAPLIPKDKTVVSESGINSYEDIQSFRSIGVHAVLIGEALVSSTDIIRKFKVLKGV